MRRGEVQDFVRHLESGCFADADPDARALTAAGVRRALEVLPGWKVSDDRRSIRRHFACRSLGESLLFIERLAGAMGERGTLERVRFHLAADGVELELTGVRGEVTVGTVDLAGTLNEAYALRGKVEPAAEGSLARLLEVVPHWRVEPERGALEREFLFPGEGPALWFVGRALGAVHFLAGAPRVQVRFAGRSVEVRLEARDGGGISRGMVEAVSELEHLAEGGGDGESEPRARPQGDPLDQALGWRGPWGTPGALTALLHHTAEPKSVVQRRPS